MKNSVFSREKAAVGCHRLQLLAIASALAFFLAAAPLRAEPREIIAPDGSVVLIYPAGEEPQPDPSPVTMDPDAGVVHFGNVDLLTATKTVVCTGWVNQAKGLVEVLACGEEGKLHESVFVLAVNPLDLQAALLLAGNRAGEPMAGLGIGPPRGSPVDLWVEWTGNDGEIRRERAERFVRDVSQDAPLPDGPWVYTGSMTVDGRFKAFLEETLIATFWDPYALINNPYASGGNDDILFANEELVPPLGTDIRFEITPAAADNPALDREGMPPGTPPRDRFGL